MFRVASVPSLVWKQDRLEEGLQSAQFVGQVEELLWRELGQVDTTSLVNQLILDFDSNKDGKVSRTSVFFFFSSRC